MRRRLQASKKRVAKAKSSPYDSFEVGSPSDNNKLVHQTSLLPVKPRNE